MNNIFKNIEHSAIGEKSQDNFKDLFNNINVNNKELGSSVININKKLKKIIIAIAEVNLDDYKNNSKDSFGNAYEYLMTMYASNAGKKGGEFFTPQEVSELLTRITLIDKDGKYKKEINKVYDPAAGSGSLLLNFAKIIGKENIRLGFFGQEIDIETYNLCRINMFLHNIGYDKFDIQLGDTLIEPKHLDEDKFEAIVSNPKYSVKWEGKDNGTLINDPRFSPAGVLAPKKNGDFAFIMHSLYLLAVNGTAAILSFPGIMYRTKAEQKIRKYLIDNNFVEAIIQLPEKLFHGVDIATCILVLKKNKINNRTLFIDASKEFIKGPNQNKLSTERNNYENNNIKSILDLYMQRDTIEYKSYLAKRDEIEKNDYNLSVSTYVEKENTQKVININVLNENIKKIVQKENILRDEIDKIILQIEENN